MSTLASLIDHTILRPDATADDVRRLCAEAVQHGFFTACVAGSHVQTAAAAVAGTRVKVCSIAGFPLGSEESLTKAAEAERVVELGADEVDMVANIGWIKAGRYDHLLDEIARVRDACGDAALKVIIECGLLDDDEKRRAAATVAEAGAAFVKTSTGFGHGGATVDDVRLLAATVGDRIGVKASAGIRTREQAEALVAAGATRLGTSAGISIMET